MHPDTKALLLAAIRAEVQGDPSKRGYASKSAAEITALLNTPVATAAPVVYRDVPVSSVEGYMRLRTHLVRLKRWVDESPISDLRDFAEELLGMIAGGNVGVFETSHPAKRAAILAAFGGLAAVGAGGFNAQSVIDLEAMTGAPAGSPVLGPARWLVIIEGISAAPTPEPTQNDDGTETQHPGYAGPPNAADEVLVKEALDG